MREGKIYDYFSIAMILMLLLSLVGTVRFNANTGSDIEFLWNRLVQLRNSDTPLGVFFYNDFEGLGYGSSFFYGYLTLVPFLWVKDFDIFCNLFTLVTLVVILFGTRSLVKCFTKNYRFISFLFISSLFLIVAFSTTTLYANYYAVGISFFFLSYCIKFFRDERSFIPASILFFLVLNTHMITAFMSFIGCALLLIKYFDKFKWKQYLNFFLFTSLICSYYLINFLWHSEGVLNLGVGRSVFLSQHSADLVAGDRGLMTNWGTNPVFFGGILAMLLVEPQCTFVLLSPIIALSGLLLFIKSKPKKFNIVLMFCILLSFVISIHYIWAMLYANINIIIQFPLRYLPYALILFLILCFKDCIKFRKVLGIYSLVVGILASMMLSNISFINNSSYFGWQTGNGEYLSKEFVRDKEKFMEAINSCQFEYEKDGRYTKVYVTEETSDWVRIPKLWYKGYKAVTADGKELECKMGYSQFVEFNPDGYVGEVTVYYAHTWWLYVLEVICYILVLVGGIYGCYKDRRFIFTRKSFNEESIENTY